MDELARNRPTTARLAALVAAVLMAVGLLALASPTPAHAAINPNLDTWVAQASDLRADADEIGSSAAPVAVVEHADNTLDAFASTQTGASASAAQQAHAEFASAAANGRYASAAATLDRIAAEIDNVVASYRSTDGAAGKAFEW